VSTVYPLASELYAQFFTRDGETLIDDSHYKATIGIMLADWM